MARVTVKTKAKQAQRTKVKAAIGIDGLSGNGKTFLALTLAQGLLPKEERDDWSKIYLLDTENNSALLSVGETLHTGNKVGNFYHLPLSKEEGFSPFNYDYAQQDAISKGCEVIIQDSYTHAWQRKGGVLDMVTQVSKNMKGNKNYRAWGDPDVVDAKNLIFDLIRNNKIHVISTVRIKDAYLMQENDQGRQDLKNVGEKQMQSEGLTYEFDLLMRMVEPGNKHGKPPRVEISKSRYSILEPGEVYDMTPDLIEDIKEYLNEGVDVDELQKKRREELVESIRNRAKADRTLLAIFKKDHPDKKVADLELEDLRKLNSKFIEIEYENAK